MIVGFIAIHKDDLHSIKMEIYYQTMRKISKSAYNQRPILPITIDFFV